MLMAVRRREGERGVAAGTQLAHLVGTGWLRHCIHGSHHVPPKRQVASGGILGCLRAANRLCVLNALITSVYVCVCGLRVREAAGWRLH